MNNVNKDEIQSRREFFKKRQRQPFLLLGQ